MGLLPILVAKGEMPTLMEMVVARNEIDYIVPIYEGGRFYDHQAMG